MRLLNYKILPPRAAVLPAVLSGILFAAAFPPLSVDITIFFALVPLHLALFRNELNRQQAFRLGMLFGLVYFFLLLWWVKALLPSANATVPWLMIPAMIVLVFYLSLYPALYCVLLRCLSGGKRAAAMIIAPSLWTFFEIFRSSGEMGFPWGILGYGISSRLFSVQIASYVGVFGLGWIIASVNIIFTSALLQKTITRKFLLTAAGLTVIFGNNILGRSMIENFDRQVAADSLKIAVIQPGIDLSNKWDPLFADSIFTLTERLCRDNARFDPELFVFPETSAPVYMLYDMKSRIRMSRLSSELGIPIFIGFLDGKRDKRGDLNIYNAAGLFDENGVLASQYAKIHLLPFGEALPLSSRFHFLRKINFGQANFQPGDSGPPIVFRDYFFGPLICFESIFPGLSRSLVSEGAAFLVNITNDGWFGDTPGPFQHAEMCLMRAVENRRALVRSANTGISMIVDPLGRITASMGLNEEGSLVESIPVVKKKSFYTKHGDLPVWLVLAAAAAAGLFVARRKSSG